MAAAAHRTVARLGFFVLAAAILGAMAVALNVSLAAIIYQDELARFVDRGIALTLLGAVPMAAVGAFAMAYRGTVVQPQDATAVILSLSAANIAAGLPDPGSERSFATVVAFVTVATVASGAAALILGRLKLGFIARFLPFPVVGGFIAATGYLLVEGGLAVAVGSSDHARLLDPGYLVRWLPWTVLALGVTLLARRVPHALFFPATVLVAGAGFYLVLALLGLGLEDARARQLLLGPFHAGGFLSSLGPWRPLDIEWRLVAAETPTILAVVGMTSVTALLSSAALEVVTGSRIDPDRDLAGVGLCNFAAAAGGAPVGYQILAWTLVARRMGLEGRAGGLVVAGAALLAVAFGASAIGALPVGIVVFVTLVIGFGMIIEPLVDQRRGMPAADVAVMVVIPVVTAAFGFLWGVATGLFAAVVFFVMAFARIDLVRLETTAARLRSRVERGEAEQAWLARRGAEAAVYVLAGYVFFGTAHRLASRIEGALDRAPRPRLVLVDFRRVRGIDISAARALARLAGLCREAGVELTFAGLDPAAERMVLAQCAGVEPRLAPGLDAALQAAEATLLADMPHDAARPTLVEELARRHPGAPVAGYFEAVSVPAGAMVIAQGAASDSLLLLRSGLLRIEVAIEGAPPMTVAHCLPGALVGEIGLYTGLPRTASVLAEEASAFLRIDADALERMGRDDPGLLADFHRLIAAALARRLGRTTALVADAERQAG